MGYRLGVDLGTTWSAAAVARSETGGSGTAERIEMATLGVRTAEIPSVVALLDDDTILVGSAAEQRSITEPERVAREFKRRIGDPTPLIVGGVPRSAEALMAALLKHIVATVAANEGEPPEQIVLTHPANWGPYKLERFVQIFELAGLPPGEILPEPVAAARHYLAEHPAQVGGTIAVFDFGGGTFDAAVLRHDGDRFSLVGQARGLEQLGGIDLDRSVMHHVIEAVGIDFDRLEDTPSNRAAVSRLRVDCIAAKEILSYDTVATIPVMLPDYHDEVRLTRSEFENMIRPAVNDAVTVVEATIADAGLQPEDITAFLLVGGTSRIPLVNQVLTSRLDRPVLADTHPKHVVAKGAARSRSAELSPARPTGQSVPGPAASVVPAAGPGAGSADVSAAPPTPTPVESRPIDSVPSPDPVDVSAVVVRPRGRFVFGAVVAVIAIVGMVFALTRSGSDDPTDSAATGQAEPTIASTPGATTSSTPVEETTLPSESTTIDTPAPGASFDPGTWIADDEVGQIGSPVTPHDGLFSTSGPASLPSVAWETEVIERAGTAAGGNLAFAIAPSGDRGAQLVAHDAETGELVWGDEVFATCCSNIVLTERTVSTVVNDRGPTLRILDRSNGDLIVSMPIGDLFADLPASSAYTEFELDQGVVPHQFTIERGLALVLGSTVDDGTFLAAVELKTGETRWSYYDPTTTVVPDLFVDETSAVLADTDSTSAIDLRTGDVVWTSDDLDRDHVEHLDAGILLAVDDSYDNLTGLDVRTGEPAWTVDDRLVSDLASDGTVLVEISSSSGLLQSRELATGALRWSVATSTSVDWGQLAIAGDQIFVVGRNGIVSAHRRADGDALWSGPVEGLGERDGAYIYLAVADGRLVVVEDDTLKVTTTG